MIKNQTRILFLDEEIFSFNTFQGKAWSPLKSNIKVTERQCAVKTHALLASINIDGSMDLFDIMPRSIRNDDFSNYLKQLRMKYPEGPLAIFMDNMRVHHSR